MASSGENLREASCIGDYDAVSGLLANGVNVNSQNSVNGWTALHWASHRGHARVVSLLLGQGADKNSRTKNGQLPLDLAKNGDVRNLLGGEAIADDLAGKAEHSTPSFTPNYLQHPQMVYVPPSRGVEQLSSTPVNNSLPTGSSAVCEPLAASLAGDSARGSTVAASMESCTSKSQAFLVKVRVAGVDEEDFVEVDVLARSFGDLMKSCAAELEVDVADVAKIRRLPNIIVRKDRDVERLQDGAELELVLKK